MVAIASEVRVLLNVAYAGTSAGPHSAMTRHSREGKADFHCTNSFTKAQQSAGDQATPPSIDCLPSSSFKQITIGAGSITTKYLGDDRRPISRTNEVRFERALEEGLAIQKDPSML
jgi:hypothetical protein